MAGSGGIDLGFKMANDNFKTIYINDFNKYAVMTLNANVHNIAPDNNLTIDNTDITKIAPDSVPDCDIITGGFPCQAFSAAGKRQGFADPRGTLFFNLLAVIKIKKPKIVLLENVKGIVGHDNGKTLTIILDSLRSAGYHAKWQVLNARDFNLPQNRERIFIIAFADADMCSKFDFPCPTKLTKKLADFVDFDTKKNNKYYIQKNKMKNTIYNLLTELVIDPAKLYKYTRGEVRGNADYCYCLLGTGGHNVPILLAPNGIRKLTPRETFKLQGYPDYFILPPDVSDAQQYKLCGNTVAIPVITAIANQIKKIL